MKKIFKISISAYIFLGIVNFILFGRNAYIDQSSFSNYILGKLSFRLIIAIIFGFGLFKLHKKLFSGLYEKSSLLLTSIYILFYVILAFVVNTGIILPLNSIAHSNQITLHGIISDKEFHTGKGASYFLVVKDSTTSKKYNLEVSEKVFDHYQKNDSFNKEFSIGLLGIIYRNEE